MDADADIHVWLETFVRAQSSLIVPYVISQVDQDVHYRITTTKEDRSGRSSIGQTGSISLKEGQARELGQLVIQRESGDSCRIELILSSVYIGERPYQFLCSDATSVHTTGILGVQQGS